MSGYTKGPWTISAQDECVIKTQDGGIVGVALSGAVGPECVANAQLFAAAPELLEALKYLLELGGDDDRRIAAEMAIAKAEGR